jgi:hypothetical protein
MTRESNRNRWPELAKAVDQMKAAFGDVQVLCIRENGKVVAGKPYGAGSAFIVPEEDWQPRKKK